MPEQRVWRWVVAGIVIVVILAAILVSRDRAVMLNAKEAVLNDNLAEMRRVIKQYVKDKQRAPQTLQDLVDAGYFRQLPTDPITNSNSSWEAVTDTAVASADQTESGIGDVHSGSSAI